MKILQTSLAGTLLLLAAGSGPGQEGDADWAKWILELGSDSIVEREEAVRHLESLDPSMAERLEKTTTSDPEVRDRLVSIVSTLRLRALLSKVLGPTKRATLSVKGQPLRSVAENLGKALSEEIVLEGLDPSRPTTLELSNATMWEALDALADGSDAHFEYGEQKVVLRKGKRLRLPSRTVEQFRIEVVQASRMDVWTPAGHRRSGIVSVALLYQRNLRPSPPQFGGGFRIESARDSKGVGFDVRKWPDWGNSMMGGTQSPFGLKAFVFLPAEAAPELKISGTVDLPFVIEDKVVEVPLGAGNPKTREGAFSFEVQGFGQTDAGVKFSLLVEADTSSGGNGGTREDLTAHLQRDSVAIVDEEGRPTEVGYTGGSTASFHFEAEKKVDRANKIRFRWNTKLHRVRFEWQLDGIRLPE
jgi:hypothetical protein